MLNKYNAIECMKLLVVMCITLFPIMLSGCGNAEEEMISPIVQITAGESAGSGVIYEKQEDGLIIVTAAHVLQSATDSVKVIFEDGSTAESSSYVISNTSDIAFVRVAGEEIGKNNGDKNSRNKYTAVSIDKESFDRLSGGENLILQGFNGAGEKEQINASLIYPWIFTEDFNQYMMLIRGEILPGMSGGAVFDKAGHFIGILCGVSENREVAAVPLSIIMAEYEMVGD